MMESGVAAKCIKPPKRTWLSVIVPTYNGACHLPAALDSVAWQAGNGVEVIAVDDGSTDSTPDILKTYAKRMRLCAVFRQHCGNWVSNVNHAISLADGTYLTLLHQDDFWAPHRLARLKQIVTRRPTVAMAIHPSWFIDARGQRIGLWRSSLAHVSQVPACLLYEALLVQNFIAVGAPLFQSRVLAEVGGLDEQLWYVADWDLWLRIARDYDVVNYAKPLTSFRLHKQSQTWTRTGQLQELEELRRQYDLVLGRHLDPWVAGRPDRAPLARAARYSVEVNLALAAYSHGHKTGFSHGFSHLVRAFVALGSAGQACYLRHSCIFQRTYSRWRAGLGPGN